MFFKSPSSWVSFGQPPSLKVALSPTLPFLVRGPLSSWQVPSWGWAKLAWWWDDANKAIVLFFLCDSWCFAPLFCWSFLRGLSRPPRAAFAHGYLTSRASQVALGIKTSPANAEDVRNKGPRPRLGRSPGAGAWHCSLMAILTPVSCLEKPMDSPWPCKESDTIEATQHACTHLTNCCSLGGDGGRHFGDFTLANSSQSLWKMLFLFLSSNH